MTKFNGYTLITPNNKRHTLRNVDLYEFEEYIKENYYEDCKCSKCKTNYMLFGDWTRALPRCTIVTIKRNIKILDMSTWKCKSCVSSENINKANIKYSKLSKKEKELRNSKISETAKENYNDFDYCYTMVKGLINKLKSKEDKKYFLNKLNKCKSLESIRKLNSTVRTIVGKLQWQDEEYRKKTVKGMNKVKKSISKSVKKLWKNGEYNMHQIESRLINKFGLSMDDIKDILVNKNTSNELIALSNLYKEWYFNNTNRDKDTCFYYADYVDSDVEYKIGISNDVTRRYRCYGENKYINHKPIKTFDNRYIAAFVEYKVRLLFCKPKTELIDKKDLRKVIKYVKNFTYEDNKEEIDNLWLGY